MAQRGVGFLTSCLQLQWPKKRKYMNETGASTRQAAAAFCCVIISFVKVSLVPPTKILLNITYPYVIIIPSGKACPNFNLGVLFFISGRDLLVNKRIIIYKKGEVGSGRL